MKNWQRYERAMFNELYYMYRPPRFVVKPDARDVVGLLSQEIRQIDVAVFEQGDTVRPFLSVECKRYKRKLNIKDVEAFISMRDDIGPKHAILVCPTGFSKGATLRARAANIILRTLTLEEEERLNLREIARQVFPWDETFHPVMGDALFVLDKSSAFDEWVELLEDLPFEEWETTIDNFAQIDAAKCQSALRIIAQLHWDDSWRFNAIRLLDEHAWLDDTSCALLRESETDPDTREYLDNVMGGQNK